MLRTVSLRNAVKKWMMARFCQDWLDSTFCRVISSWQNCVRTCSKHQYFSKLWESGTSVYTGDNTNCIIIFDNDRQEWSVKLITVSVNPWLVMSRKFPNAVKIAQIYLRIYRKISIVKRKRGRLMFCWKVINLNGYQQYF